MVSSDIPIAQLYVAMFGHAPDAQGLGFWAAMLDGTRSVAQVADAMFATAPARAYFPSGASSSQVISSFYLNVLGRTADAQGLAYWTEKLNQPGATAGSVIAQMVDVVAHYGGSDPAGLSSAALFANRTEAALFYGRNGGSVDNATEVLRSVTSDPATVLAARELHVKSASGYVDMGGFTGVTLESIAGAVEITHVPDAASVHLGPGSSPYYTIQFDLADPTPASNSLAVYLPPYASNSSFADVTLKAAGVERLSLVASPLTLPGSVHLNNQHFDSISLAGPAYFMLQDGSAALIDGTALAGSSDPTNPGDLVSASLAPGERFVGSSGNDWLSARGTGGTVDGGAGDDYLEVMSGSVTLIGGAGKDRFSTHGLASAIADFQVGSDRLDLTTLVKASTYTKDGWPVFYYGTWFSSAIALGSSATLQSYLDAACAKTTTNGSDPISWFHFGGNTYVVVDNNPQATTFQSDSDFVVMLTGVLNLGGLTYNYGQLA